MNPDISNIHSGFGWILTPRCAPLGGAALDSGFGQALGNLGPAHGPRPGPGPMGPCPLGLGPARARAHGALPIGPGSGLGPCMGPCPLGPGPARAQGALPIGPNGPWPIWGSKNRQKKKVLRMRFSIVENVRTPSGIVLSYLETSSSHMGQNQKNHRF